MHYVYPALNKENFFTDKFIQRKSQKRKPLKRFLPTQRERKNNPLTLIKSFSLKSNFVSMRLVNMGLIIQHISIFSL